MFFATNFYNYQTCFGPILYQGPLMTLPANDLFNCNSMLDRLGRPAPLNTSSLN